MIPTAGFGYAFEDLKLRDWSRPVGLDDFSGNVSDVLHRPLINQPGTKFQYGVSWFRLGRRYCRTSLWFIARGLFSIIYLPAAGYQRHQLLSHD